MAALGLPRAFVWLVAAVGSMTNLPPDEVDSIEFFSGKAALSRGCQLAGLRTGLTVRVLFHIVATAMIAPHVVCSDPSNISVTFFHTANTKLRWQASTCCLLIEIRCGFSGCRILQWDGSFVSARTGVWVLVCMLPCFRGEVTVLSASIIPR
jgi:hypothetical protein